jgi:hypothetical protein
VSASPILSLLTRANAVPPTSTQRDRLYSALALSACTWLNPCTHTQLHEYKRKEIELGRKPTKPDGHGGFEEEKPPKVKRRGRGRGEGWGEGGPYSCAHMIFH